MGKTPDLRRLASGFQLWRANWLGRLRLADDEGESISSAELKHIIADDLAARGLTRYPKSGEQLPVRGYAPGDSPPGEEPDDNR